VLWIIRYCKGYNKDKIFHPLNTTLFFLGAVFFGLIIMGVSTYVSNTIRYHNPLYTILGNTNGDPVSIMVSGDFEGFGHGKRFFVSLFSKASNIQPVSSPQIKIPFYLILLN
jgi:hypothetical protein